jgi:hypothetical protein
MIAATLALIARNAILLPCIEVYVFGSVLHSSTPADIDLVAVYRHRSCLDKFRERMSHCAGEYLLDVTAMTPTELEGSGFFARSGAKPLHVIQFKWPMLAPG